MENGIPFQKLTGKPERESDQIIDLKPTSRDSFEWDGTKITNYIGQGVKVVIPKGTTEIGKNAFRGCDFVKTVVIPKTVKTIGSGAFKDCPNLMIRGRAGSEAEKYAEKNGIPFEAE